ncbi:MAG: hypothetical protein AB8G14_16235 [Ilumatobacter sp.]
MDAVVVPTQQLIEREAITGSRSFDQLEVVGLDGDAPTVTNDDSLPWACRGSTEPSG